MAGRVRYFWVRCCVTWGPPVTGPYNPASCVSSAASLGGLAHTEQQQQQHRTIQQTKEFTWFSVRPPRAINRRFLYLEERGEDYTLNSLLLSRYEKKKKTKM